MQLTMKRVMDYQQTEHFYNWLESKYLIEDQSDIEDRIHAALREYPDLLERGKSWPEVLTYAPDPTS